MKRNKMLTMLMLGMTASALLFTGCEMPWAAGSGNEAEDEDGGKDKDGDSDIMVIEQKMIENGYRAHVITTQETDVNEEYLNNRAHLIEIIASVKNEIERESNNE